MKPALISFFCLLSICQIKQAHAQVHKQGDMFLHLSLPYVNSFHFKPAMEEAKNNTGFLGIAAGLDYFHGEKQFINISGGAVMDFLVPVPAPVHYSGGEHTSMNALFFSVSNNHQINRFLVGYGLSYAQNTWELTTPANREPTDKTNNALGFTFSSYYKIGRSFNIGLIYRPSLFNLSTGTTFNYEHVISLDLAWKIKLTK